jgi:SulP family sulfate permease
LVHNQLGLFYIHDFSFYVHTTSLSSHGWDDSTVAAVDKIVNKFEENNIIVNVTGLNDRIK